MMAQKEVDGKILREGKKGVKGRREIKRLVTQLEQRARGVEEFNQFQRLNH